MGARLGFDHEAFPWAEFGQEFLAELQDLLLAVGMEPEQIDACRHAVHLISWRDDDIPWPQHLLPHAQAPPIAISRREFLALFAVCARDSSPRGLRDTALLSALYAGPMNPRDACGLLAADYQRDSSELLVRARGPRSPERRIPLGPVAKNAVVRWAAMRPLPPSSGPLFLCVTRDVRATGSALIPGSVLYTLRHRARQAGIRWRSTARALKRASIFEMLLAGAPPEAIVGRLTGPKEELSPISAEGRPGTSAPKRSGQEPTNTDFHAW